MTALKIKDTNDTCRINIPTSIFTEAYYDYSFTLWAYISSNTTDGHLLSFKSYSESYYIAKNYYLFHPY